MLCCQVSSSSPQSLWLPTLLLLLPSPSSPTLLRGVLPPPSSSSQTLPPVPPQQAQPVILSSARRTLLPALLQAVPLWSAWPQGRGRRLLQPLLSLYCDTVTSSSLVCFFNFAVFVLLSCYYFNKEIVGGATLQLHCTVVCSVHTCYIHSCSFRECLSVLSSI